MQKKRRHTKRPRPFHTLRREGGFKEGYKRVLLVTEGTKSEPYYFNAMLKDLSLSSVKVLPSRGSSPTSIIDHAKEIYDAEPDIFESIFCIFDKDGHGKSYLDAIGRIKDINLHLKEEKFFAITSIPSFEYWFLLHYLYTRSAFQTADKLIKELKNHIPKYEKNFEHYSLLKEKMEQAVKRAKQSVKDAENEGNEDPSTKIYLVIECLKNIRK
jgi:hypothetical protein